VRVAFILSVAAGFAFGLVSGAADLVGRGLPVLEQPTSVIWANRVFTSRHELAVWLTARGGSYGDWSSRHPLLASRFEVRFREPTAGPSPAQSAEATGSRGGRSHSSGLIIVGGISLVTILGMSVLVLFRRMPSARMPVRSTLRARARSRRESHGAGSRSSPRLEPGQVRAALPPLLSVPLSVPRPLGGRSVPWREWLGQLVEVGRAGGELGRVAAHSMPNRQFVRRFLPRAAFYATSGLLAFAIGAWIAIYLK